MFQYREAANFPWRSQAAWLYSQMTRWDGTPFSARGGEGGAGRVPAGPVSRGAGGIGAPLPGASSKMEGAIGEATGVGRDAGAADPWGAIAFFDGRAFDPDEHTGVSRGSTV